MPHTHPTSPSRRQRESSPARQLSVRERTSDASPTHMRPYGAAYASTKCLASAFDPQLPDLPSARSCLPARLCMLSRATGPTANCGCRKIAGYLFDFRIAQSVVVRNRVSSKSILCGGYRDALGRISWLLFISARSPLDKHSIGFSFLSLSRSRNETFLSRLSILCAVRRSCAPRNKVIATAGMRDVLLGGGKPARATPCHVVL